LGAIVDLTAHARDRMPQYALLLAFYTLLVLGAIRLLSLAERTLMPRLAGRAP
jgi:hypothetical protein